MHAECRRRIIKRQHGLGALAAAIGFGQDRHPESSSRSARGVDQTKAGPTGVKIHFDALRAPSLAM
jgi:hypothetical protein